MCIGAGQIVKYVPRTCQQLFWGVSVTKSLDSVSLAGLAGPVSQNVVGSNPGHQLKRLYFFMIPYLRPILAVCAYFYGILRLIIYVNTYERSFFINCARF